MHGTSIKAAALTSSSLFALTSLLIVVIALPASAQEAEAVFTQNCAACHSIGGGRLVGPDLRDVTERKDRAWLADFIVDAPSVIAQGDPYARKLVDEARGVIMPKPVGIDKNAAFALLDYIAARSGETPTASAAPIVLTPEDASVGKAYFLGHRTPVNGAAACITCHQSAHLDAPGGGLLGPDLTQAFTRLGGAAGLTAWLGAPATPTMRAIFRDRPLTAEEITSITAFFQESARGNAADAGAATAANSITFLLFGIIAAVASLGLIDWIWRRRFTSVRERLVRGGGRDEKRSRA